MDEALDPAAEQAAAGLGQKRRDDIPTQKSPRILLNRGLLLC
jgi:hypothetical protein